MAKNKKSTKKQSDIKTDKPLSKEAKKILTFAYIWYQGMLGLAFISAITLWIVFYNVDGLREYTPFAALGAGGFFLTVIGVEQMIASARKMPHMFCVAQSLKRRNMTPEKIDWCQLDNKEFIYTGMGVSILGVVLIGLGVLFTFII